MRSAFILVVAAAALAAPVMQIVAESAAEYAAEAAVRGLASRSRPALDAEWLAAAKKAPLPAAEIQAFGPKSDQDLRSAVRGSPDPAFRRAGALPFR